MWRTPSKICRILDILWNRNLITALLFIQNVFAFSLFVFLFTKITQPGPQVFSVNGSITCSGLHFWRHIDIIGSIWQNFWPHWFSMTKFIPNLVDSSWLWWIMHVVLNECCITLNSYGWHICKSIAENITFYYIFILVLPSDLLEEHSKVLRMQLSP